MLLAFHSIKVNRLQEELERLRSSVNNEIHTVNQNISSIYGDVQEMLEEEANQLAVSEWEYALTYTDEQYAAAIELPLFDRNEVSMVKLSDNGTIRTQELDWIIEPRYEALLLSYAGMGGSASGKPGKGEYIWSTEYAVTINIERKGPFQIQSVELVEVLDGKEINRIPVDLSREGQEAYAEAILIFDESGNVIYEMDPEFFQ